jgi:hypothetical protein
MKRNKLNRKELLIITSCIGVVTGALLRIVTTSSSVWLYTLTAGFLIGLVTTTLLVWLFVLFLEPFSNRSWPPYKESRSRKLWLRAILVALSLVIVASYMTIIYTATKGLYLEAIVTTLLFLLFLFLGARLSLSSSPSPRGSTWAHLMMTLLIAAWAGVISLMGGFFGLSLAVLVILLDPVLRLLTDYWLLSGIFYGAILGAVASTRL